MGHFNIWLTWSLKSWWEFVLPLNAKKKLISGINRVSVEFSEAAPSVVSCSFVSGVSNSAASLSPCVSHTRVRQTVIMDRKWNYTSNYGPLPSVFPYMWEPPWIGTIYNLTTLLSFIMVSSNWWSLNPFNIELPLLESALLKSVINCKIFN